MTALRSKQACQKPEQEEHEVMKDMKWAVDPPEPEPLGWDVKGN